jgi:soluble lytic murein transglycosylase
VTWYSAHKPQTGVGAYYHLKALGTQGLSHKVPALAKEYWVSLNFQNDDEQKFLKAFGKHLTASDHWKRTEKLLWDERADQALRMIKFLPHDKVLLTHARVHLIKDLPGVEGAIAHVPKALSNDEGLWYSRSKWRRLRKMDNAGDYLLTHASKNPAWAPYWAKERIYVTRELINHKRYGEGYKLISQHGLTQGASYADAEWLAGWLALRFVNKPQEALKHFMALHEKVATPMSKGRAAYWAALAANALKQGPAHTAWLHKAAAHPAHFYGQLAHKKLHNKAIPGLTTQPLTPKDKAAFDASNDAQMVRLLLESGQEKYLLIYLEHLAEHLSPHNRRCLLGFLETNGHRFTVHAARKMARFQTILVPEAYPTLKRYTNMPTELDAAFVHAVIRQESSFDPKATSGAGAMGLMQMLAGTAKEVAGKLGIKLQKADLHNRPELNVRLGQHHLKKMLTRYNGSHAITLAAYNAGPGNLARWLSSVGDPRGSKMDLIDWIEHLPYGETRDYIHRVLENYAIYQQILPQKGVGV